MQEKSESDILSENLIKAFIQFKKLRMNENAEYNSNRAQSGLKHSEIMLLFELCELEGKYPGGVSVTHISQSLCVKPPSITPVITNLEHKKMIERTMDINDRRIIRVRLTEVGSQFIEENKNHMISQIKGLVEYLGVEKSSNLASLIDEVFNYFYNREPKQ